MKPYHSVILFLALVVAAVWASSRSYRTTENALVSDMSQALCQTIKLRQERCITPDTIRAYRSLLHHEALRRKSTLTYAMEDGRRLTTQRMAGCGSLVQGLAGCSRAEVFGMSNQRLPLMLLAMAMLWAAASTMWFRRKPAVQALTTDGQCVVLAEEEQRDAEPSFSYDSLADRFLDQHQEPIHLTPMQHQLLRMLYTADGQELSKQAICEALWPKKPDAADTLYALVRRTKTIVEQHSRLTIVAERGRAYRLAERQA